MMKKLVSNSTVFISYSGPRSQLFAQFIYKWLEKYLEGAQSWATFRQNTDCQLGENDYNAILDAARNSGACVAIITPENRERAWLSFETGIFFGREKPVHVITCDMGISILRHSGHHLAWQNAIDSPELVKVRNLLIMLNEQLGLNIDNALIRATAQAAFGEYLAKYHEYFPKMSMAERETRGFDDHLSD